MKETQKGPSGRVSEGKRRNMQAVKSSASKIEQILGKALWAQGIRYRKNDATVVGKPDFTLKSLKLAIFCDSEFWHGKDWKHRQHDFNSNVHFWKKKIKRNMQRDQEVNKLLRASGWLVIRVWGRDILKDPTRQAAMIKSKARKRIRF